LDAHLVPFVDGVAYGLLLFVVAAGMMAAFAVGGVLNLAHGVLVALGAYTAATLTDGTWIATGLALLVGTVAGAGGGGLLATVPTRSGAEATWCRRCSPWASRSSAPMRCGQPSDRTT
jgi:branched-subunit amino acid ABC-type transport system permease component